MTAQLQGLGQEVSPAFRAHIQSVRYFLRDFTQLNQLTRGEESSDRMIAWATLDMLSDFNGTPPFSSMTMEAMLGRHLSHLAVRGTVISLLESVMILHARNHLPYSDGSMSYQLHDKAPFIQAMLSVFQSAYEQNKRLVKTAINIEELLDVGPSGVHSDYYTLSNLGFF